MAANLEAAHGDRVSQDCFRGRPELAEVHDGAHESQAECGDEAELHESERYRVPELGEDDLPSIRGKRRGGVP